MNELGFTALNGGGPVDVAKCKDTMPRSVTKPDGRVIKLATFGEIKTALASNAKVLDVRD